MKKIKKSNSEYAQSIQNCVIEYISYGKNDYDVDSRIDSQLERMKCMIGFLADQLVQNGMDLNLLLDKIYGYHSNITVVEEKNKEI